MIEAHFASLPFRATLSNRLHHFSPASQFSGHSSRIHIARSSHPPVPPREQGRPSPPRRASQIWR